MKRILVGLAIGVIAVVAGFLFSRERTLSVEEISVTEQVVSGVEKSHRVAVPVVAQSSVQSSASLIQASPSDYAKMSLLEEVLSSKNDNDPRLDRELKRLSVGAKALFQVRYGKYPLESRNERGTIVFLLGRNLTSESDFHFLQQVLNEPPCLSMADCGNELPGSTSSDSLHHEGGTGVSLAYPQLVALKSIEAYLSGAHQTANLTAAALRDLEAARQSPISRVAAMADEVLQRYRRTHRRTQ